ncbi:MAG: hypothetical protein HY664_08495 [Chloroflexi bacterium]|nr:hypothetical protein [Chloroflexota bacterium]
MPTREEIQSLAQGIISSYENRIGDMKQLRETVKLGLKDFQNSRVAIGRELRAELTKNTTDLKQEVSTQLSSFNNAHAAMSKEMKAELAKGVADLHRDVMAILKGFDTELRETGTELAEGRQAWRELAATMHAKRGRPIIEAKPPTAAPPVIEALGEEMNVSPEITALQNRVFVYLAHHPEGTRMAELEQEFGLARIQMARLIRNLIDENKIEKRDFLYFPI